MELDDLKNAWTKYDKRLTENLKFNEELLRKINLDRSKREMSTPLYYEFFTIIGGGILVLFILSSTLRFADNLVLLLSGILTIAMCLFGSVFTMQKINLLSKIDYYNSSILDLQKALAKVKKKYLQYKRGEIFLFPIFTLLAIPIVAKGLRNFDILAHSERYFIAIISALALGYPILIWIYKNWYEKQLQNADEFLKELNRFEKEE